MNNNILYLTLASTTLLCLHPLSNTANAAEVILSGATNPPLTGTSGAVSTNAPITTANDEETLRINAQVDLTVTAGNNITNTNVGGAVPDAIDINFPGGGGSNISITIDAGAEVSNNGINGDTIQLSGGSTINNFTLDVSGNLKNNAAGLTANAIDMAVGTINGVSNITFQNGSTLDGGIVMSTATNNVNITFNTVTIEDTPNIVTGSNDDYLTFGGANAQIFNSVTTGGADDTVYITNSQVTFNGNVDLGTGVDTLDIDAGIYSNNFYTGNSSDTIQLNNATFNGIFSGDAIGESDDTDTALIDGGTVRFNNNIIGIGDFNVNAARALEMNIGGGNTYTGTITEGTAGGQSVSLMSGTFSNNINLGNGADILNISGATFGGSYTGGTGADTITYTGGSYETASFSDAGGTHSTFNIDSDLTLDGNIEIDGFSLDIDNNATANVADAGALGNATALDGIRVANGASFNVNANADASGGIFTNNGTTTIANGVTLLAGDYAGAAGSVLIFATAKNGDNPVAGSLDAGAATATDFDNTTIRITNVTTGGTVSSLLQNVELNSATDNVNVTDDSFLLSAALIGNGGNTDLRITADTNTISNTLTNDHIKTVSPVLSALIEAPPTPNNELNAFLNNLSTASNANQVNTIIEGTVTDMGSVGAQASTDIYHDIANTIDNRIETIFDLRGLPGLASSSQTTGISTGNPAPYMRGIQFWGEAFGSIGKQDARSGFQGYDVKSGGVSVGADREFDNGAIGGIAFTYAKTEVDSKDAGLTQTDIDTYNLSLYGSYALGENTYISGKGGYGFSKNDVTRMAPTAREFDYNAQQFSASAELGRSYRLHHNVDVIPYTGLNYLHYSADSYTDPIAGGLKVEMDDYQTLEAVIGAELAYTHRFTSGSILRPYVSAEAGHDFIGDEVESTSQFSGGGATFTTQGFDSQDNSLTFGGGLVFETIGNIEFSTDYEYEKRGDFSSHAGRIKTSLRF